MKCTALLFAVVVSATACSAKEDDVPKVTPSADEILEANVTAMGGREAFAKIDAIRINASFSIKKYGVKGTMSIFQKRPNLSYTKANVVGAGTEEGGCDGTTCWKKSDAEGVRILTGEERDEELREAILDSELRWRELYAKVEAIGPADYAGHKTWKVVFTTPSGSPETKYYDRKTHLEVGGEEIDRDQTGEALIKSRTLEWGTIDGITWPRLGVVTRDDMEIEMKANDILINPRIDADQFELPFDVRQLRDGAAPAEAP